MSVAEDIKNKLDQVEVNYNPDHWDGLEIMLDKKQNKKIFVWWILGLGLLLLGGGTWYAFQADKNSNATIAEELNVSSKQNLDLENNRRNLEERNVILDNEMISKVDQDKSGVSIKSDKIKEREKESRVNYKQDNELSKVSIERLGENRLALKSNVNQFKELTKQSEIYNSKKASFLGDKIKTQTLPAPAKSLSVQEIESYNRAFYKLDNMDDYVLFNSVFQDDYNGERGEKSNSKRKFVDHYISLSTTPTVLFNSQLTKPIKVNGLEFSYEGFWKNKIGWSIGLGYNRQSLLVTNCNSQEAIFANDFAELGESSSCLNYNLSRNNLVVPISFKWKAIQKGRNSLLLNAGVESTFTVSSKFNRPNSETLLSNISSDLTPLELQFLEQNYASQPFSIAIKTGVAYNYSIRDNWLLDVQTNYLLKMNDIGESNSNGLQFTLGLKYKFK